MIKVTRETRETRVKEDILDPEDLSDPRGRKVTQDREDSGDLRDQKVRKDRRGKEDYPVSSKMSLLSPLRDCPRHWMRRLMQLR